MPRPKQGKVTGLNGAVAMTKELEILTGTNSAAAWIGDERKPIFGAKKAPTQAELIDYLARQGRDITANDADGKQFAEIITKRIAKHLKKTADKTPNGPNKPPKPKEVHAKAGLAAGLRAAAKLNAKKMTARIESGTTNTGASADDVGIQYAIRREEKYHVNESVVYVASGQLVNDLIRGKVTLFLENADVGRLLDNLE